MKFLVALGLHSNIRRSEARRRTIGWDMCTYVRLGWSLQAKKRIGRNALTLQRSQFARSCCYFSPSVCFWALIQNGGGRSAKEFRRYAVKRVKVSQSGCFLSSPRSPCDTKIHGKILLSLCMRVLTSPCWWSSLDRVPVLVNSQASSSEHESKLNFHRHLLAKASHTSPLFTQTIHRALLNLPRVLFCRGQNAKLWTLRLAAGDIAEGTHALMDQSWHFPPPVLLPHPSYLFCMPM